MTFVSRRPGARVMADNVFFIDNNHFWLGGSYNSAYVNQIRFDKT